MWKKNLFDGFSRSSFLIHLARDVFIWMPDANVDEMCEEEKKILGGWTTDRYRCFSDNKQFTFSFNYKQSEIEERRQICLFMQLNHHFERFNWITMRNWTFIFHSAMFDSIMAKDLRRSQICLLCKSESEYEWRLSRLECFGPSARSARVSNSVYLAQTPNI